MVSTSTKNAPKYIAIQLDLKKASCKLQNTNELTTIC